MAAITVRNIPDDVHQALKVLAAQNGRSTEAEIRVILENAVRPKERLKIATELRKFALKHNIELHTAPRTELPRIMDFGE